MGLRLRQAAPQPLASRETLRGACMRLIAVNAARDAGTARGDVWRRLCAWVRAMPIRSRAMSLYCNLLLVPRPWFVRCMSVASVACVVHVFSGASRSLCVCVCVIAHVSLADCGSSSQLFRKFVLHRVPLHGMGKPCEHSPAIVAHSFSERRLWPPAQSHLDSSRWVRVCSRPLRAGPLVIARAGA